MAAAKIKKGDSVVVRSGKDKGRSGTVLQVMPKDGKLLVQGINIAVRHRKPSQDNPQGGIDRREAPLAISKVGLADPKTGKATRVRFETKDGNKVRVAVKSGETING
jgi:large subunit ribosomal protein L24